MLRHIVMFRFMENADGRTKAENLKMAMQMLNDLVGPVPSLKRMEVGINDTKADQSNYDMVLTADFDDLEGLKAYVVHPEHVKCAEFIGKVRSERACVDFII